MIGQLPGTTVQYQDADVEKCGFVFRVVIETFCKGHTTLTVYDQVGRNYSHQVHCDADAATIHEWVMWLINHAVTCMQMTFDDARRAGTKPYQEMV